jgi:hypothetical protein
MRHHLKILFSAGSFLFFAQILPAQNFITSAPAGPPPPSGGMIGNGSGVVDNSFYGPENASSNSFFYGDTGADISLGITPLSSPTASTSGASPSEVYGFAQGSADFVASTYMSYKKALELGKQTLQQQNAPSSDASLGDVARALRATTQSGSEKPKILTWSQDNSGKIVACKSNTGKCS